MSASSSDIISLIDATGNVLCASTSSAEVFGYPARALIGRNISELIHPDDRPHSRYALTVVLARPEIARQVRVRVVQPAGDWSWVESTISNFLNQPRVNAIVVACREIAVTRMPAEEAQQHADELVKANARLEDFAYAVAHDLREPLRTISMFTQLLAREGQLDARGQQKAQFIVDGVARMAALFEGLHAFALRGFDDPSPRLDLRHVVSEVLLDLGHAIAVSGATVTVGALPFVCGNDKHLARVFQNLISNAIKYRGIEPVKIHISAERLGPDWMIKVRDNGVGIPSEQQDLVFQLFKRLHGPETPGAGIGLAICRKIVEAMGGAIWVESEPGKGSVFCFTIAPDIGELHPESFDQPTPIKQRVQTAGAGGSGRSNVLSMDMNQIAGAA
jgi:PAS domain S-box-containing protein